MPHRLLRARLAPALLLLALLAGRPAAAQEVIGLAPGATPGAATIEDLDGNAVDLLAITRGKPAVIQFWATWCPLCEELHPRMQEIRRRHGDAVEIVFVAVAVNQTQRAIRRYAERHPLPGRVLWDTRGQATRAFRAPTTSYVVVLDAAGRVAYTGVGADQDIAGAVAKLLPR
jgi:thiol-disulfide isomerase/thioredoxin